MGKKNKIILLLFMLFVLLPLFSFAQSEKTLNKWGVGAGYNFLHRSVLPFNERTFEISVKYLYTDKHSFYLTVPFYFENNKDEQKDFKLGIFNDPWVHRIWGIGVGYNYTVFEWNGISGFLGGGFDFIHEKYLSIQYSYDLDDSGNQFESYSTGGTVFRGYGLSPQIGLSYRFKHLGCEFKYKFSVFRIRDTFVLKNKKGEDVYDKNKTDLVDHYFKCSQGLSLSLYYYF